MHIYFSTPSSHDPLSLPKNVGDISGILAVKDMSEKFFPEKSWSDGNPLLGMERAGAKEVTFPDEGATESVNIA